MKLRNKKTDYVANWCIDKDVIRTCDGSIVYNSLAELNEEWEDYEEHKDHWHIGCEGDVFIDNTERYLSSYSSIGNDFETREEAEKAVEKLKAWKRLKDKGFRFTAWYGGSKNISYEITSLDNETYIIPRQICDDLDLLFGGEE